MTWAGQKINLTLYNTWDIKLWALLSKLCKADHTGRFGPKNSHFAPQIISWFTVYELIY